MGVDGPPGIDKMDAIEHYTYTLKFLNMEVARQQQIYTAKMDELDELDLARIKRNKNPKSRAEFVGFFLLQQVQSFLDPFSHEAKAVGDIVTNSMKDLLKDAWASQMDNSSDVGGEVNAEDQEEVDTKTEPEKVMEILRRAEVRITSASPLHKASGANIKAHLTGLDLIEELDEELGTLSNHIEDLPGYNHGDRKELTGIGEEFSDILKQGEEIAKETAKAAKYGLKGVGTEVINTVGIVSTGAVKGTIAAVRTAEILTLGALYNTSSTAFVTFNSRVAKAISYQMLLSQEHYLMTVKMAPNPKDVLWGNVSTPEVQIQQRVMVADAICVFGALFWSYIVSSIYSVSNLDTIAKFIPSLKAYKGTVVYDQAGQYLALLILLIMLISLPLIFDTMSRYYEKLKLESDIQKSIMSRYFYYQLANVYVTICSGTIVGSFTLILRRPETIVSILGENLPQVSIYFANLIIVRTLLGLPLEMLRPWPLLNLLSVKTCYDRKKMTRRELRTGAFADYGMWYGWCYPQIMMVMMIVITYATFSPFLMPIGAVFFGFCYLMYKYQLLYTYINDYQSGGFDWLIQFIIYIFQLCKRLIFWILYFLILLRFAVFDRCMVAQICGALTVAGYLGIRKSHYSGPFYFTLPLPAFLLYFWYKCDKQYRAPSTVSNLFAIKLTVNLHICYFKKICRRYH